jgi:exopolyphosphatase/guanosine-5'-triphosphate,3'-diphosphate pyrophosphatase
MKIAVLDLGTNTFNLLIAEIFNSQYTIIHSSKMPVRLGEGGITKNNITLPAMQRGVEALLVHKDKILEFNVDKIYAFATSAVRDAKNGTEYTKHIKNETGFDIKIISGDTEAELICKGVKLALLFEAEPYLIMDIGGGSTEFIISNNKEILWQKSFQLGVSRLLEMFNPLDPISDANIKEITNYLKNELAPLYAAVVKYPCAQLVGSSGSFDTLADIASLHFFKKPLTENTKEYLFALSDFSFLYNLLLPTTLQERLKIQGMLPMRADMMVVGIILINEVITNCKIQKVKMSAYSLKEGVLAAIINNEF